MKQVAVLYNASKSLIKGEPHDLLAEQGVIACAQAIAAALPDAGYQVELVPIYDKVEMALAPYDPTQWIVFNLGEGLEGRLFEEARIAWALEAMGFQFTGSGGEAIARSVHKAQAKALMEAHGVATPRWWLLRHPDELDADTAATLPFPLIVKPVAEDASIGVGPDAVVHSLTALRERVAYVVERYRQAALVEAFVTGREFNIAMWGNPPELLPLAEIDFSAFSDPYARIVSFAAKWEESSFEYQHTPVRCPAQVHPRLEAAIRETALRAWTAIGCKGYARVDMRVSEDGVPHVVEVNCNPDLSPDAGFFHAARTGGHDYRDMVVRILEIARREAYGYYRDSLRAGRRANTGDNSKNGGLYAHGSELRTGALGRIPG